MNKQELQILIDRKFSVAQLSKHFQKPKSTITYWLKKYELKTLFLKGNKGPDQLFCSICKNNNQDDFYLKGNRRFKCKQCHGKRLKERTDAKKTELVNYKGGQCQKCGYSKCIAALEFHHRDPKLKDHEWYNSRKWKLDKLKEELDKCDLLCANCHRETHFNQNT